MKPKVISIDLRKLPQTDLCFACNPPVNIDNAFAWCEKCDSASLQSQCKLKADVKIVVFSESDQLISIIQVPHALSETIFNLAISKTPKEDIVKIFISKTFSFTLNKANECLDMYN